MNKKALGIVAGALIAAAPLVSSAADSLPAPFEGSSVLQADGVVKGVDQAKHAVTVRRRAWRRSIVHRHRTSNLAQIHQGSKVHIRMMRSALVSADARRGAAVQSSPQNVTAEVRRSIARPAWSA